MDPIELPELARVLEGHWFSPDALPPRAATGARRSAPVRGVSTDSRAVEPGELFVPLRGPRFDGHDFLPDVLGARCTALVERRRLDDVRRRLGVPSGGAPRAGIEWLVVEDALVSLERLARWQRARLAAEVIGITGSVGKTTVKEFVATVLAAAASTVRAPRSFNNRIGVARTLLATDASTRYVVAEMGTSGPGEMAHLAALVQPTMALVTAVAAAHLAGLRDLAGVAAEKADLCASLAPGGRCLLADGLPHEERFLEAARRSGARVIRFGFGVGAGAPCAYRVTRIESGTRGRAPAAALGYEFEVNGRERFRLPVPGRHNVANALAAIAVARELGIDWATVRSAVARFRLPPKRLEAAEAGGVIVVDDSYNANPASLDAALASLDDIPLDGGGRWFLVLGDLLELGEASRRHHVRIGEELAASRRFAHLWTVGDEARRAGEAAARAGLPWDALAAGADAAAVEGLARSLRPGDGILLKGSRGVALDRTAAVLRDVLGRRWEAARGSGAIEGEGRDGVPPRRRA